jgi:hypothetical protein
MVETSASAWTIRRSPSSTSAGWAQKLSDPGMRRRGPSWRISFGLAYSLGSAGPSGPVISGARGRGGLQLLHLVVGADDADRLSAEVDRDRVCLHPGDVTHPIHVVTDQVGDRRLLDGWLGLGLERGYWRDVAAVPRMVWSFASSMRLPRLPSELGLGRVRRVR